MNRKRILLTVTVIFALLSPISSMAQAPNASRNTAHSDDVGVLLEALPNQAAKGNILIYRLTAYDSTGDLDNGGFTIVTTLPRSVVYRGVYAPTGTCNTPRVGSTGVVTCVFNRLPEFERYLSAITVTVNAPTGNVLVATSQISGPKPDPDLSNNSITLRTPVVQPDVDLAAVFRRETERAAKDRPYAYSIGMGNGGPTAGFSVVLSHTLPAGFQFASIETFGRGDICTRPPVGATGRITCKLDFVLPGETMEAKVTVTPTLVAGTPFTLTAAVNSSTPDRDLGNNTFETSDFAVVAPQADISIGVFADPTNVGQGAMQRIGFSASNNGPEAASNVVVTGTLPEGAQFGFLQNTQPGGECQFPAPGNSGTFTCTIEALPVASQAWTMGAFVTIVAPVDSILTTTMRISSATADPNPEDNASALTHAPVAPATADLRMLSYDPDRPTLPGGRVRISPNVINNGANLVYPAVITTTLPQDVVFAGLEFYGDFIWQCNTPAVGVTGDVVCQFFVRPIFPLPNHNDVVGYSVFVTTSAPIGTVQRFTSTVGSPLPDPNPDNNVVVNTTQVVTPVNDLAVQQSADPLQAKLRDPLKYTLAVFNRGNDIARNIVITDVLPVEVGFINIVSNSAALRCQTPAPGATGLITCTLGLLDLSGIIAFDVNVQINTLNPNGLTNVLSASSSMTTMSEATPEDNTTTSQLPVQGYCSRPNVVIPDNNPRGVLDVITPPNPQTLTDVDVYVQISHTYVSDLVVTLEHSRTFTTLLDRPGLPRTRYGCPGDNVGAWFDDEARNVAEDQCTRPSPPNTAIAGDVKPNSRLSTFYNTDSSGAWGLRVRDRHSRDVGRLVQWCLVPR